MLLRNKTRKRTFWRSNCSLNANKQRQPLANNKTLSLASSSGHSSHRHSNRSRMLLLVPLRLSSTRRYAHESWSGIC